MLLNKYTILVLLALGLFLGGYFSGKQDIQTVVQEKVVYKEGETLTVYRDRIVTVTKIVKPDGTVTEITKTEDKDKTQDKKTTEVDKDKSTTTTPVLSKYSLGLYTQKELASNWLLRDNYKYGVSAGYRVLSPLWLKSIYFPTDKLIMVGIEIEF